MRNHLYLLAVLLLLPACEATPAPVGIVPTLAVLPTVTETLVPSATLTLTATETATLTLTPMPSETVTLTVTPSLTITDTPTPTMTDTPLPTDTPTPTEVTPAVAGLLQLALQATVLPLPALPSALTPGQPALPPVNTNCAFPPPGSFAAAHTPDVIALIGCPASATAISLTTAVQTFEQGMMLYLSGSPGTIYALANDGRFRRFDDRWLQGVDPEDGPEVAPFNLFEPVRGFGKIWRENPDVRATLGWGTNAEAGAEGSYVPFDRGRMLYLPQRGEILVLVDDPGGFSGTWRAQPGSP